MLGGETTCNDFFPTGPWCNTRYSYSAISDHEIKVWTLFCPTTVNISNPQQFAKKKLAIG